MSLSSTDDMFLQEKWQFLSLFSLVQDFYKRNHEIQSDKAEILKMTLMKYHCIEELISENTSRKLDKFKRIFMILQIIFR